MNQQIYSDYWNGREMRAKVAYHHTIIMQTQFQMAIENSVVNSSIYSEELETPWFIRNVKFRYKPRIVLMPMDTVTALFSIKSEDRICILNFASYKYPGGKFMEGSSAQEESLCHSSILYNVLKNSKFDRYYSYNRAHTDNGLYENRAIYSPRIVFFGAGNGPYLDEKMADVITCAAPNAKQFYENIINCNQNNNDIIAKTIYNRCKFVLDIAEYNYADYLILGAFGCGVFGCNPRIVSKMFKKAINNGTYGFKQIIFAIPNDGGHSSNNYYEFVRTFEIL